MGSPRNSLGAASRVACCSSIIDESAPSSTPELHLKSNQFQPSRLNMAAGASHTCSRGRRGASGRRCQLPWALAGKTEKLSLHPLSPFTHEGQIMVGGAPWTPTHVHVLLRPFIRNNSHHNSDPSQISLYCCFVLNLNFLLGVQQQNTPGEVKSLN